MDKKDINIAEKVTDAKSNLSRLPQIDRWLGSDLPEGIREKYSRKTIIDCMRSLLDKKRTAAIAGSEEVDRAQFIEGELNSLQNSITATKAEIDTVQQQIKDLESGVSGVSGDLDKSRKPFGRHGLQAGIKYGHTYSSFL